MLDGVATALYTSSFTSLWYWIFLALAWNSLSHWTMGVPYDAVVRADRKGGEFAAHVDDIAHAMSLRMVHVMRVARVYLAAAGGFVLSGLLVASFGFGFEFAQAILVFVGPLSLVAAKEAMFAERVVAQNLRGSDLRRALFWQRFQTQLAGVVSLVLATGFLVFELVRTKPHLFLQ